MNAPAFATADTTAIQAETAVAVQSTQALTVTDATTYAEAGERLKFLRNAARKVEDWFRPLVEAAHRAHRELTTRRGETLRPVEAECTRLTVEMSRWKAEQDRLARERAAQQAREEQELARSVALEEAVTLEAQGMPEEAAAVVEQAIAAPAPVIPIAQAAPKVDGISHRETWKYEVVDANQIPREFLSIDEKKIGAVVRALKGSTRIPGIRVYAEQSTVVRAS
jgi:hypothetical protein